MPKDEPDARSALTPDDTGRDDSTHAHSQGSDETCDDLFCPHHGERNCEASSRRLVEYDWLDTLSGDKLHHAELTAEQHVRMGYDSALSETVRLTCGRTVDYVTIPGVFTRMGADRCAACCRHLGYPPGTGSPKNDDRIRRILGLDDESRAAVNQPERRHGG